MLINVILYTKKGCGLCDEVKEKLSTLQAHYPHQLTEIDITKEPAVFAAFKHSIPVVEAEDIRLFAPITQEDLVRLLNL